MKKKTEPATIGNVLRLFSKRLEDFKGESRRGYQKAYSSFQLFVVANYSPSSSFDSTVIEDWVAVNILQGLTRKTVSFYLDKISSLYGGIAHKLIGGKESLFKDIKKKLKELPDIGYSLVINRILTNLHQRTVKNISKDKKDCLIDRIENLSVNEYPSARESVKFIWSCLALKAGVLPHVVKYIMGKVPPQLGFLNICENKEIPEGIRSKAFQTVAQSLKGEEPQWFAMRLRPKVKFENILQRFSILSDSMKMPELFYPSEEIAKKVGRKMVWKGKPVIRDVVFFKTHKQTIYPLFTKLYDLAWCYRTPGGGTGNYAAIPEKAMEDFKNALGFLGPEFEVMPAGEMKLKPGDKVVIVDGEYASENAAILKTASFNEDGNKIYRVTLLNQNGHWDIGVDARLLKKI